MIRWELRPVRAVARRGTLAFAALALVLGSAAHAGMPGDSTTIDWIRRTAAPFDTCAFRADHRDLASLRALVGDARIVGLGEGTHGTREFFQMKHRITEYLASELGFRYFAIEASMPEAYRLNDYVLHGVGDPRALIRGMYFWTWRTQEVLDMVEWMRRFNASGKGHVEFLGFDMQTPDTALAIVRRWCVRNDPASAVVCDSLAGDLPRLFGVTGGFVTAKASLPASRLAGHHVRYEGWIRTREVSEFAGLWMRADAGQRTAVAFDNMQARSIQGTTKWSRQALELDIPKEADQIDFGMLMAGNGHAWFDSLAIEIDGEPWRPDSTLDLAVEGASLPRGFSCWGGDPPTYFSAMDDSGSAVGAWSLHLYGRKGTRNASALAAALGHAARVRAALEGTPARTASVEWATQNARVLEQSLRYLARPQIRDSAMAANIAWILDHTAKGGKLVLWAHNGHISRVPSTMGAALAARFGAAYRPIGFATGDGTYRAMRSGKLTSDLNLEAPYDGTLEALCVASGRPRFLLDLRGYAENDAVRGRLGAGVWMRSIGALAVEHQFMPCALPRAYDGLLWIEHTSSAIEMDR